AAGKRRAAARASQVEVQTQEESKEKIGGSQVEVDAGRVEEESDLPRRRSRLALAARRQVHRDRRAVQPADGSVHDRARRAEGEGLAREGRSALGGGLEAAQDQADRLDALAELLDFLARQLVDEPDAVRVEELDEPDALV